MERCGEMVLGRFITNFFCVGGNLEFVYVAGNWQVSQYDWKCTRLRKNIVQFFEEYRSCKKSLRIKFLRSCSERADCLHPHVSMSVGHFHISFRKAYFRTFAT